MITVSESIQNIVRESPLLEEGLSVGIINLSALARRIRPQVEAQLMKPVSDSAVMMALKRLSEHIQETSRQQAKFLKGMGDITVRSSLSEFTFQISDTILEKEKQLLHKSPAKGTVSSPLPRVCSKLRLSSAPILKKMWKRCSPGRNGSQN